jgi:molecular chaperone DnaK
VPAGNQVIVHMNLTLDGTLKVTAIEKRTDLQRQVRIENALARFQREERDEARRRLDELFEAASTTLPDFEAASPGEPSAPLPQQIDEVALHRSLAQARALLDKAEHLLPSVADEDRAAIEDLMTRLRDAVTERRLADLETQSAELADVLYYLEEA